MRDAMTMLKVGAVDVDAVVVVVVAAALISVKEAVPFT